MIDNNYFNEDRAKELIKEWQDTGNIDGDLMIIMTKLHLHVIKASNYKNYPLAVKEDMLSQAMFDFLRWGKGYKADKGSKAFSYFTFSTQNSFKLVLKKYYRFENEKRLAAEYYNALDCGHKVSISKDDDSLGY